jgi:hypothetical protein
MPQNVSKTQSKWCINKHGASKIIDTFETYHMSSGQSPHNKFGLSKDRVVGYDHYQWHL